MRADVPGRVEGNPVFIFHDAFNPNTAEVDDLKERYRQGKVGDVEVKRKLTVALNNFLDPIRERRAAYETKAGFVEEIVHAGNERVGAIAAETIRMVEDAMGMIYFR